MRVVERHAKSADRKEMASYYVSAPGQVLHIEEKSLQRTKVQDGKRRKKGEAMQRARKMEEQMQ